MNARLIGLSANGLSEHEEWVKDINEYGSRIGPTDVKFPIVRSIYCLESRSLRLYSQIADESREISTLYDMLDALDPTNRDAKGLPFTVSRVFAPVVDLLLTGKMIAILIGSHGVRYRPQEGDPPHGLLPS